MPVLETQPNPKQRITITKNGPYRVEGGLPLVCKTQVVSEHGEPLTWKKDGSLPTSGVYELCRCGQSRQHPFCDGTHETTGFDGTERADTTPNAARQAALPGSPRLVVKKDAMICMNAGFCGLRNLALAQLAAEADDSHARSLAIAMIERCPSGSLTYQVEPGGPEIEPDLPAQVAVTTEITSQGPIPGPLWVTGEVEIVRSDGKPFAVRNRVTLCNCGLSFNKPLCDGTHRFEAQRLLRARGKLE